MSRVLDQAVQTVLKATRHDFTLAGVNLAKRRTWYADDPQQTGGEEKPAEKPEQDAPADEMPDWVKDPEKAYEEIKKLREESAQHRTKARDVETRLKAIEDERKLGEEKQLADQENWKALAERRAEELAKAAEVARLAQAKAIVLEFGLPKELAGRLQGTTEDELRADAESLAALIPKPDEKKTAPGGRQGSTTTSVPGGSPAKETDAQRRARLQGGGGSNMFSGGEVRLPEGLT